MNPMLVLKASRLGLFSAALLLSTGCERLARPVVDAATEDFAQVTLFNASHDVVAIRTQTLRRQYQVDCDLIGADPGRFIKDIHLTNPLRRFLFSGVEIGLDTSAELDDGRRQPNQCRYAFVSLADERLPSQALQWPASLDTRGYFRDVDLPPDIPPDPPALLLEADYSSTPESEIRPWRARPCDGNLSLCSAQNQSNALSIPPNAAYYWSITGEDLTAANWEEQPYDELALGGAGEECAIGGRHLHWEAISTGRFEVLEVIASHTADPDDETTENPGLAPLCFDVVLRAQDGTSTETIWEFCGSERLSRRLNPADIRGSLFMETFTETRPQYPNAYENLSLDLEWYSDDGELFQVETIELVRGRRIPEHLGLSWETEPLMACEGLRELPECSQVVLPLQLNLDTNVGPLRGRAGETIALEPQAERRLELVRAMHRVVVDTNCYDGSLGPGQIGHIGPYMEFVYFAGVNLIGN